jgi:hypothetical protein
MRNKEFARTNEGLRDALMSEMEDIRAGVATPAEAQAFALLAKQVISSLETDIAIMLREDRLEQEKYQRKQNELKAEMQARQIALEERQETMRLEYDGDDYE